MLKLYDVGRVKSKTAEPFPGVADGGYHGEVSHQELATTLHEAAARGDHAAVRQLTNAAKDEANFHHREGNTAESAAFSSLAKLGDAAAKHIVEHGGGGSVHVDGYTRADGTTVKPYDRTGR